LVAPRDQLNAQLADAYGRIKIVETNECKRYAQLAALQEAVVVESGEVIVFACLHIVAQTDPILIKFQSAPCPKCIAEKRKEDALAAAKALLGEKP